jgi:hypothetical protein
VAVSGSARSRLAGDHEEVRPESQPCQVGQDQREHDVMLEGHGAIVSIDDDQPIAALRRG